MSVGLAVVGADLSAIASAGPSAKIARNLGLDALRAALTLLVVFHHTAITYGGSGGWFYTERATDGSASSILLTLLCAIDQSYFMGLFFLLAGYYAPGAVDRHGVGGYAKERLIRLGIPLAVFFFLLGPATIALVHAAKGESFVGALLRLWRHGVFERGPLWFAEALLIFGAGYLIWRAIRPAARDGAAKPFPSNAILLAAALGTGAAAFALRLVFPLGHDYFGLQLGFFASYIVLFVAGCAGASGQWLSQIPPGQRRLWGVIAWIAGPILPLSLVIAPNLDGFVGGMNLQALVYAFWEPFVAWGIILALVAGFQRWFVTLSPVWKTLTRRAYAIYIIHPPILVGVALAWRAVAAPPLLKFAITGSLACLICYGVAGLLLRIRGLDRVL
jgi:peptidoglycan/LPS O-acetylase OafA/YrhL